MRTIVPALILAAVAAIAPAMCAESNLVADLGFERPAKANGLPAGWWLWEQDKGWTECAVDTGVKRSGKSSLRMTLPKASQATLVSPDVPVAPGETFDVSVWVRTKGLKLAGASGTVTVNAAFRRADGKFLRFVKFGKPIGGEWKQLSAEATIPSGTSKLAFELGIKNASGTVWFDDCSVVARNQFAIRPVTDSKEIPMGKSTWPVEIINRTGEKREVQLEARLGSSWSATPIALDGSLLQKAEVALNAPNAGAKGPLQVRLTSADQKEALAELNVEDARVLNPVELEPLVPTHWCIEDGTPTLEARVWNHTPAAAKELTVTLTDEKGAVLYSKTATAAKPGWQDITLSSSRAGLGDYEVEVKLTTSDGKTYAASQPWHVIHRSQAIVTINAEGFCVADGKPIFPLGTYNSGRYDLMVRTGFTVTHAWNRMYVGPEGTRTNNQLALDYLNDTQKAGMHALGFIHVAWMEQQDWEGLRRRIRMFRNHPALLAWDTEEGVARGEIPIDRQEKLSKIIREEDPNHPFCLADSYDIVNKVDRSKFFRNDLMDIGMWWYYPIPLRGDDDASGLLGRDKGSGMTLMPPTWIVSTDKPAWWGMQAYVPNVPGGRLPADAEFRCMAYLALANGAKGMLYYMGGSAWKMNGCTEDRPWGYLQTLVPEISSLIPVLLTRTVLDTVTVAPADCPVSTLVKQLDGQYTLIVVNRGVKPVDLTISTGCLGSKPVTVLFEGRSLTSDNGALKDRFKGYEVHVYRFAK